MPSVCSSAAQSPPLAAVYSLYKAEEETSGIVVVMLCLPPESREPTLPFREEMF